MTTKAQDALRKIIELRQASAYRTEDLFFMAVRIAEEALATEQEEQFFMAVRIARKALTSEQAELTDEEIWDIWVKAPRFATVPEAVRAIIAASKAKS